MSRAIDIPLLGLCAVLLLLARRKRWVDGWVVVGLATVTAGTAVVVLAPGVFHSIRAEKFMLLLALGLPFACAVGLLLRRLPVGFGVCAALALLFSLSSPAMGSTSISIVRYILAAIPALVVLGASGIER